MDIRMEVWNAFRQLMAGKNSDGGEHGNELSVSINYLEFLEWLSYFWLLKKDSAQWS
jgi:hypothetical protein